MGTKISSLQYNQIVALSYQNYLPLPSVSTNLVMCALRENIDQHVHSSVGSRGVARTPFEIKLFQIHGLVFEN